MYSNGEDECKLRFSVSFCKVCLAQDRKLSELGDFTALFSKICDISNVQEQMMICWECKAILKKVKNFQMRALRAQQILSYEFPPAYSLSTITSKTLEDDKYVYVIDKLLTPEENDDNSDLHEGKDSLAEVLIKNEYDDGIEGTYENMGSGSDDDDSSVSSLIDDMPLSKRIDSIVKMDTKDHKLKDEEAQKIKQEESDHYGIKNKSRNKDDDSKVLSSSFDIKGGNSSKAAKIMHPLPNDPARHSYKKIGSIHNKIKVKKIKINPDEVSQWREKEKASEYFKRSKLKCDSCIVGFSKEEALKRHNRIKHSNKYQNKCKICLRTMPDMHFPVHDSKHNEVYMCECDYQCYTRYHMKWHLIKSHGTKFECLECRCLFVTLNDYYHHYKKSHSGFKCDPCGESFPSKGAIRSHIINTHRIPSECKMCNKTFKSKFNYKKHVESQHTVCPSENTYCVECDKHFENREKYTSHINNSAAHRREKKQSPQKTYPCSHCDKVFSSAFSRKLHVDYIHLGKTKHYCTECERYFRTGHKLRLHKERKHLGIAPVKNKTCSVCRRAFTTNSTLIHHMRTHTGERPHECQFCDAKFAQKYAMKTHVKHVHLNVKRKPD